MSSSTEVCTREKRNELLLETDYLGCSDIVMSEEMRVYRQALRDLPNDARWPEPNIWPTKPT